MNHPKFGNISQNRLREIVRLKNEENFISKKETLKRIEPDSVATLRLNDQKPAERAAIRKSQLEVLPRIKVHS